MAKKQDNLEDLRKAIETQVESLDPAQREFVKAEFRTYEWNAAQIEKIQAEIDSGAVYEDVKAEAAILRERHQLVTEQAALFSHIMRWLKGTAPEGKAEIEEFM